MRSSTFATTGIYSLHDNAIGTKHVRARRPAKIYPVPPLALDGPAHGGKQSVYGND